ncbi:MAG TPA: hypothetical protein VFC80_01725 [Sphaerochaeta sp.]|nr:hypothetical protein [Sphaerochaeta sp.]
MQRFNTLPRLYLSLKSITVLGLLLLCLPPLTAAIVLYPLESKEKLLITSIEPEVRTDQMSIPICHVRVLTAGFGIGTLSFVTEPLQCEGEQEVIRYRLRTKEGAQALFDCRCCDEGLIDCGEVWAYLQRPLRAGKRYHSTVRVYLQVER